MSRRIESKTRREGPRSSAVQPRWVIFGVSASNFRIAELFDGAYRVLDYLPSFSNFEQAQRVLIGMGGATTGCKQCSVREAALCEVRAEAARDLEQANRRFEAALNRDLVGRVRTQEEVERLNREYARLSGLLREALAARDAALADVRSGQTREKNLLDEKRDMIRNYEDAFRRLEREKNDLVAQLKTATDKK